MAKYWLKQHRKKIRRGQLTHVRMTILIIGLGLIDHVLSLSTMVVQDHHRSKTEFDHYVGKHVLEPTLIIGD